MSVRGEFKAAEKAKRKVQDSGAKKEVQSDKRVSYKARFESIQACRDQCEDRLLRTLAEFDNMKKRFERDRAQIIASANSGLILRILPVLDDLERSLKTEYQGDELRLGVEMVVKKMAKLLEDEGVTAIHSVGEPFNVDVHDALLVVEKQDTPSGVVVEEHEKGYRMHDRVLRHARVIVSK